MAIGIIDDDTLTKVVELGVLRFDYDTSTISPARQGMTGNSILWGEAVKDLDVVLDLMAKYPGSNFSLDIGTGGMDCSWMPVHAAQVARLRELWLARWGTVEHVSNWLEA